MIKLSKIKGMYEINIDVKDFAILLVEPSSTQRKIITNRLMLSLVKRIDVVASVEEALLYLEEGPAIPDLVICSMYFDNMSGTDLVKKMKSDPRLETVPFMLLSSETDEEKLLEFRQAGVIAILPKPFTAEELQHALEVVHDSLAIQELDLEIFEVDRVKFLIVDDSSTSRLYIKHFLYNMGFNHIQEATDPNHAIGILEEEEFDIIIVDQEMPNQTGIEFVKQLKTRAKYFTVPMIMVTSSNLDTLDNPLEAGLAKVFQKPLEPKAFREHLKNLLEEP